jgi:hypothetical protein
MEKGQKRSLYGQIYIGKRAGNIRWRIRDFLRIHFGPIRLQNQSGANIMGDIRGLIEDLGS